MSPPPTSELLVVRQLTAGGASSAPANCTPPVEGAYPCAGGPVPAEATEVQSVIVSYGTHTAVIASPSGNIGCDIYVYGAESSMLCIVESWSTAAPVEPVNIPPHGGVPTLDFGDGSAPPVYGGGKTDAPYFMPGACPSETGPVTTQVIGYGQIVHYGGFVCASAETGMTCWNASTGHGAFFSRDALRTF